MCMFFACKYTCVKFILSPTAPPPLDSLTVDPPTKTVTVEGNGSADSEPGGCSNLSPGDTKCNTV